jgi:hypothetical protein
MSNGCQTWSGWVVSQCYTITVVVLSTVFAFLFLSSGVNANYFVYYISSCVAMRMLQCHTITVVALSTVFAFLFLSSGEC